MSTKSNARSFLDFFLFYFFIPLLFISMCLVDVILFSLGFNLAHSMLGLSIVISLRLVSFFERRMIEEWMKIFLEAYLRESLASSFFLLARD